MDLKTIGITGFIALGLGGALGIALPAGEPEIRTHAEIKAEACDGKFIQYSEGDNYYCGTLEQYDYSWKIEEKKFKDNKTTKEDYVYLDLVAKNDPDKRKILEDDLIAKYDTKTKMFNGSEMGADFNYQLMFFGTLANLACDGGCELVGDTMNEKLYNLISK